MNSITDTPICAAPGCRNECPRDGREQALLALYCEACLPIVLARRESARAKFPSEVLVDETTFRRWLRVQRKLRGLTLAQAAKTAGMHPELWRRIELSIVDGSAYAPRIAAALDLPLGVVMAGLGIQSHEGAES